jgi:hypothetical protein
VLECFIETAKASLKGQKTKFQYILSDGTNKIVDIDGDEFAECDYGLSIEDTRKTQETHQKMEQLAQTMVQNQMLSTSDLLKILNSNSMAEIIRTMQQSEQQIKEQQQQQIQAEQDLQREEIQRKAELEQEKVRIQEANNIRDNDTKLAIAGMQVMDNEQLTIDNEEAENRRQKTEELAEKKREFDIKQELEREKFNFEKIATREDQKLKLKQINKPSATKK